MFFSNLMGQHVGILWEDKQKLLIKYVILWEDL